MPPPKRPKTGLSWVDDFIETSETTSQHCGGDNPQQHDTEAETHHISVSDPDQILKLGEKIDNDPAEVVCSRNNKQENQITVPMVNDCDNDDVICIMDDEPSPQALLEAKPESSDISAVNIGQKLPTSQTSLLSMLQDGNESGSDQGQGQEMPELMPIPNGNHYYNCSSGPERPYIQNSQSRLPDSGGASLETSGANERRYSFDSSIHTQSAREFEDSSEEGLNKGRRWSDSATYRFVPTLITKHLDKNVHAARQEKDVFHHKEQRQLISQNLQCLKNIGYQTGKPFRSYSNSSNGFQKPITSGDHESIRERSSSLSQTERHQQLPPFMRKTQNQTSMSMLYHAFSALGSVASPNPPTGIMMNSSSQSFIENNSHDRFDNFQKLNAQEQSNSRTSLQSSHQRTYTGGQSIQEPVGRVTSERNNMKNSGSPKDSFGSYGGLLLPAAQVTPFRDPGAERAAYLRDNLPVTTAHSITPSQQAHMTFFSSKSVESERNHKLKEAHARVQQKVYPLVPEYRHDELVTHKMHQDPERKGGMNANVAPPCRNQQNDIRMQPVDLSTSMLPSRENMESNMAKMLSSGDCVRSWYDNVGRVHHDEHHYAESPCSSVSSSPDRMNSASVSSHDSSPMTQSDRFIPHTPHRTPHDIIRNHGDATTPSLGSPGHPSSVGSMSPLQDSDSRDGNYGNSTNSNDFYSNPYTEDLEEKMFFNGQAISKEGGKRCQICNDVASGFHYGVWSCEGCKAFFKRSLQGPVDYVCPATNNCTIDKHRRKSCQACRLRKCIETGMSRGNCREKKGVRQYQRHSKKRHTSSDCEVIESKLPKLNSEVSPGRKEPQVCPVRPIVDPNGNRPPSCQAPTLPPPPIHPLVEHLMKIDPPVRFSNHSLCEPETAEIILGTLLKLIDTELTDVVAWARGIPGYMSLPLQGRMQLLELSWLELLTLGLIWRSIPHDHILACAPDLHLSQARVGRAEYWPIMKKVLFLVNTVKQLKVNREEMVLLRACVLLNAGVTQLSEDENYQDLQNKIHGALHYTVISRHQGSTSRLSRLLLLLPQLRQISLEFWSYLSDLHHNNKLPRDCTLVGEILATRKISLHL